MDFVWIVRKSEDLLWLRKELAHLKELLNVAKGLRISIYVTREGEVTAEKPELREKEAEESRGAFLTAEDPHGPLLEDLLAVHDSRFSVAFLRDHHPSVEEILFDFQERVGNVGGVAEIVGSGPEAMGSDLRSAISKTHDSQPLQFYWDSRG